MAKTNVLQALYEKRKSPLEFNFDMLTAPPLLSLVTPQDIYELNRIARSVKLSGKIEEKYKLIDNIMTRRGFVKLHAGTNRVVYRFLEDQRFVLKIAVDRVGLGDNPAEYNNQFLLKPFVTKIFEVSSCGTVAVVERVDAILSREEFASVADDVFNLLTKFIIGKYVIEDAGSQYFMNFGIRKSYGVVLLDFPYLYELDGNKLYCNAHPIPGRRDIICGGEIDYDDGFNNLICTKCGRTYQARTLKKAEKENLIIVGGKKTMRVQVKIGSKIIKDSGERKVSTVIEPPVEETIVPEVIEEVKEPIKEELDIELEGTYNPDGSINITGASVPEDKVIEKLVIEQKEIPLRDRVQSRTDKEIKYTVDTRPNASILVKKEEQPKPVIHEPNEELKVSKDMTDKLDDALNRMVEDDDEDEYEEYSNYLSNRQRSSKVRTKMKSSKRGNSDFNGF